MCSCIIYYTLRSAPDFYDCLWPAYVNILIWSVQHGLGKLFDWSRMSRGHKSRVTRMWFKWAQDSVGLTTTGVLMALTCTLYGPGPHAGWASALALDGPWPARWTDPAQPTGWMGLNPHAWWASARTWKVPAHTLDGPWATRWTGPARPYVYGLLPARRWASARTWMGLAHTVDGPCPVHTLDGLDPPTSWKLWTRPIVAWASESDGPGPQANQLSPK